MPLFGLLDQFVGDVPEGEVASRRMVRFKARSKKGRGDATTTWARTGRGLKKGKRENTTTATTGKKEEETKEEKSKVCGLLD